MKWRLAFVVITVLFLSSIELSAQQGTSEVSTDVAFTEAPTDVAFWVAYWGKPRVILFGPEEEAFNQNVHEILFPWNEDDDHPSDRFYIEGYASSRGELRYNLDLSKRRAAWVKQTLISKGIAENRIVLAVPWGQLLPVCPDLNDECWSKNRVVRFVYSPS